MAKRADEHARAFRKVPRDEMLERLRADSVKAMDIFRSLSDDDWTGLIVSHPYMGPLPAMFYPMFQLVDYAVHSWDIREGIGLPHALSGDATDLLVPIIYILMQATADTSSVAEPYSVGLRTSGRNGGEMRMDVSSEGVQYAPGRSTTARRSSSSTRPPSCSRDTAASTGERCAVTARWPATSAACSSRSDRRDTVCSERSRACCARPSTRYPAKGGWSPPRPSSRMPKR